MTGTYSLQKNFVRESCGLLFSGVSCTLIVKEEVDDGTLADAVPVDPEE